MISSVSLLHLVQLLPSVLLELLLLLRQRLLQHLVSLVLLLQCLLLEQRSLAFLFVQLLLGLFPLDKLLDFRIPVSLELGDQAFLVCLFLGLELLL